MLAQRPSSPVIVFGIGFGTITDIITGPGGMYVLSLEGNLYRISEITTGPIMMAQLAELSTPVPEPSAVGLVSVLGLLALIRQRRP